jgi:hypothetical protein
MLLTGGLDFDDGLTCAIRASAKKMTVAGRRFRKRLMV